MDDITAFFTNDHFAAGCGVELVSAAPGHAIARMHIETRHHNAIGTAQGGAIFTLADFAFAVASNSHGTVALAANVSITYMKAVRAGLLTAEAKEISTNPRLGSYTVTVTDETGDVVALFQGLAYRKKDALPLRATN
jgi:acyl-CoA thioesterase